MLSLLRQKRAYSASAAAVKHHMSKQAAGILALGGVAVFFALVATGKPVPSQPPVVVAAVEESAPAPATAVIASEVNPQRQAKLREIKNILLDLDKRFDRLEDDILAYYQQQQASARRC